MGFVVDLVGQGLARRPLRRWLCMENGLVVMAKPRSVALDNILVRVVCDQTRLQSMRHGLSQAKGRGDYWKTGCASCSSYASRDNVVV